MPNDAANRTGVVAPIVDYSAVLADLELKKAAIENAITGIRALIQSGANNTVVTASARVSVPTLDTNGQIPNNAFLGKSIVEAARVYLQMVHSKKTTAEIAEALRRGGVETTSDNFEQTVAAGLNRISRKEREIVKLGGKWGLADWFGGVPLNRVKKAKAPRPQVPKSAAGAETLPQRVLKVLNSRPEVTFSPALIRQALGGAVRPKDLGSVLIRLVKSGRAVKLGPSQYQAPKTKVVAA